MISMQKKGVRELSGKQSLCGKKSDHYIHDVNSSSATSMVQHSPTHMSLVWRALIGRLLQEPGWRFFGRDHDDAF
jgi:hypothetical protein